MESRKYPETIKLTNLLPQLVMLVMWIVQIFLTIDKEFLLAAAWPTPYKDAFNEDFTFFYIFYSVILLLICVLSAIRPRFSAIVIPCIFVFELYTFISPIIYKAIYYDTTLALRYTSAAFDVTNSFFYARTLKSFIILAVVAMLFWAIFSKKKKVTLILFAISFLIVTAFLIFEAINFIETDSVTALQDELISKSIIIGILRMTTLLPIFFIGFNDTVKTN